VCADCDPGEYCAGGTAAAVACDDGDGTWDDDSDPATACAERTTCATGSYVASEGDATTDRTCTACALGRYSSTVNAPSCSAWTICVAGQSIGTVGSATADRVCSACADGSFSITENATSCTPWATCVPGQYEAEEGSPSANRVCTGCSSGSFSITNNAASCTPWQTCVAGRYVSNTPSDTVDQVCMDCAPGTYTAMDNLSMCLAHGMCAAGTVQTAAGTSTTAPVCATCSPGEYCAGHTTAAVACGGSTWDHDGSPATACATRTDCGAGQSVVSDGNATTNRTCAACTGETYSTATNAPSCTPWAVCAAGTYVSTAGSAAVNRACMPCAMGEYSADPNQMMCLPHGMCAAGTEQSAAGTSMAAPVCDACSPGEYCAGGTTPALTCGGSAWDDDGNPATPCGARTNCVAGQSVASDGNATTNRTCAACTGETYSTAMNAPSCTPWTVCAAGTYVSSVGSAAINRACTMCALGEYSTDPNQEMCTPWQVCGSGYVEGQAGSPTMDRTCVPEEWTRQFGSTSYDLAVSVSASSDGSVLVAGYTNGTLPGQSSAGGQDAYLQKLDAGGNVLWTRQFGSANSDAAYSVRVGSDGSVLVAGYTLGTLPGESSAGGQDGFVRKYDAAGNVLWTRQFGTVSSDLARSVSVGSDGSVLVAGFTNGALPGQSSAGGQDAFVRKFDTNGAEVWTRQFGTVSNDLALSVSVGSDGSVLVAGHTDGTLPGQSSAGGYDAFARKYDAAGAEVWTRQFGSSNADYALSVSVGSDGSVLAAGQTDGILPGQSSAGGPSAFVRKYDAAGAEVWTRQFGTANFDVAASVSVGSDGSVLVAGSTNGSLPGQSSAGSNDAFVRKYDAAGAEVWTRQFGTASSDSATEVSLGTDGSVLLAGYTDGTLPGQSSAGSTDAFVMRLAEP
jgi:hypothetical protein